MNITVHYVRQAKPLNFHQPKTWMSFSILRSHRFYGPHTYIVHVRSRTDTICTSSQFFFFVIVAMSLINSNTRPEKKLMAIFVLFSPPVGVCHAIFAISLWINNNYIVVWWCVVRGGGVMNTFAELRINDKT